MKVTRGHDASMQVEEAAEVRRLQPVDGAAIAPRPASVSWTYVELEYDELAGEQEPLWQAEGALSSRAAEQDRDESRAAFKEARRHLKSQRALVDRARSAHAQTLECLGPFRRREVGAKRWYLIRWSFLLGGDVAGQAGAALAYGESPMTALPQALATGMAALTAGMVGAELRDLRNARRRNRDVEELPEHLGPWAHLFRAPDLGRGIACLIVGIGAAAGLAIAGGIFWLRTIIEGSAAGGVYGLLAIGITLASTINSYFYADEVADQIDAAEARYQSELTRADRLAAHRELQRHAGSRREAASIREEHTARGLAAARRLAALKWRVLGNNPGVVGHGPSSGPDAAPDPIGRRHRDRDRDRADEGDGDES